MKVYCQKKQRVIYLYKLGREDGERMREIGGYIELDTYTGGIYHEGAAALNCGRAALEYLLESRGIAKLYVPYFCCDSIAEPCRKRGVLVEYYNIDITLRPIFDKKLDEGQWLYIINYYGQLNEAELAEYGGRFGRVIADNTQAYYQKPVSGMDTLYSCRKYFGVPDGGFLYTDKPLDRELPRDESFARMRYIMGRFERGANEFYPEACANNEFFSGEGVKRMSRLTDNLLRAIDYEAVKRRRTENFEYLHRRLRDINKLELTVPEGAFMYPLLIEGGAEKRKKLQGERIYIPTLWPDVFELCTGDMPEYFLAENILPIPVDQRYTVDDMKYICEVLENV